MPKNDTNDLSEQSDVDDQKSPKITKSNQRWSKTTKKMIQNNPRRPKMTWNLSKWLKMPKNDTNDLNQQSDVNDQK